MTVASFLVPGVPVPSALPRQHLGILQDMLANGFQFSLPTGSLKKQQPTNPPLFVKRLSYKNISSKFSSPPSTLSLLP